MKIMVSVTGLDSSLVIFDIVTVRTLVLSFRTVQRPGA